MTAQEIQKNRDAITADIADQRLAQAIARLEQLAALAADAPLRERLEQVKVSYDLMLRYLSRGVLDPQRGDVLGHIVGELSTLTDSLVIALEEKDSPEVFYARRRELKDVDLSALLERYRTERGKLRLLRSVDETVRDRAAILQVTKSCEQCETNIFNKVWSTYPTPTGDSQLISHFIADDDVPQHARCLMVMALLVGLMKFYDEPKLILLIDAYAASDCPDVQLRAIISVLLTMNSYRHRVEQSRALQPHIDAMTECPTFADDIAMVIYRLIGTRNTDRVTRQVTQDIMPDIIKASPDLINKLRSRQQPADPDELEANPEWQRMLEDNGVAAKMEQFSQLQQEGNDVFISTFSRLKSYPFFRTLSNWFLPYHNGHSVVQETFGDDDHLLRDMVARAPYMCNSDRFSFCLTLHSIPESQRQMMRSQSAQHIEQLDEMRADRVVERNSQQRDTIATRCVQDLYRFFKLFSRRREFLAAIDTAIDFTALPYLSAYTDARETLLVIAEFYLKNEFDQEAVSYFTRLLHTQQSTDPIVLQKLGFAHERLGNTRDAIKYYKCYELANDSDLWTLRHIASCYRALHKPDKAIDYYRRIDQIKPNQVANTLNMGHALLESGSIEQALQCYYKADLLDDTRHRAWRPIAWCSFLLASDERSLDYYNRIIDSGTGTATDHINRGHVHLCAGRIADAIADYRHALTLTDNNAATLRESILDDLPHLQARGLSEQDVRLVIDASTLNNS